MVIKRKQISAIAAEKIDLPEEVIDDLMSDFYKEFHTQASSMNHSRLNVIGLGQFYIVKKRLFGKINKVKKTLSFMESKESTSIAKYETRLNKKEEIEKMEKMHAFIVQEQTDKREFKKKHREQ